MPGAPDRDPRGSFRATCARARGTGTLDGGRRGAGWRRAGSPVEWSLGLLEQLADVVQAEARSQFPEIADLDTERLSRPSRTARVHADPQELVDDLLERPSGPPHLRLELGRNVFVEADGGAHVLMLI